jgi:exonuclease SbcC
VPAELPDITARLAELADQAALFDKLSQNVEASRTRCSEHERAVAASAQALAGLRAEAKTLADGADKSRTTGDEAIAELTKIVKRWSWGDVAESITAKRDPSALVSRMLDDAQKACDGLERRIGALEQEAKRIERDIKLAVEHRTRLVAVRAQASLHTLLADLLHANQFRDWYIGEAMALLAEAATLRLGSLDPDQRYALQVSKDGEFVIVDRWQAGAERSPETLSGGETFVVSLALALALAEQLPQIQSAAAASLDSLFLDEGFGTLDADTLEPVMTALQGLRLEGRLVGIVTHVTELSDRIGTRIEVTKAPEGSSITLVGAPGE